MPFSRRAAKGFFFVLFLKKWKWTIIWKASVCVCTSLTTVLKINIKPLIEVTAEIPHGPLVLTRERLTGLLHFLFVTLLRGVTRPSTICCVATHYVTTTKVRKEKKKRRKGAENKCWSSFQRRNLCHLWWYYRSDPSGLSIWRCQPPPLPLQPAPLRQMFI